MQDLRDLPARALAAFRERVGIRAPLVPTRLLGHEIYLRRGVVRNPPDYDDAWFLACAARARRVFDVGANQGQAALLALLCPSVEEVVLIDPNPQALTLASEALIKNGLSHKARFICAFVSSTSGESVRFWTVGAGAAGSMYAGHAVTAARMQKSYDVPTLCLDDLVAANTEVPDLVKIDVEGAERLVLDGAKFLASRRETKWLVEMHSNPELSMTDNANAVLRWCGENGHVAWYLAEGVRLETPAPIADRGRCHLLLQPREWPYPAWLMGVPQGASLDLVR